jgi:hypothetical protein
MGLQAVGELPSAHRLVPSLLVRRPAEREEATVLVVHLQARPLG